MSSLSSFCDSIILLFQRFKAEQERLNTSSQSIDRAPFFRQTNIGPKPLAPKCWIQPVAFVWPPRPTMCNIVQQCGWCWIRLAEPFPSFVSRPEAHDLKFHWVSRSWSLPHCANALPASYTVTGLTGLRSVPMRSVLWACRRKAIGYKTRNSRPLGNQS